MGLHLEGQVIMRKIIEAEMKDYRIDVKVRNHRLLSAVEASKYGTGSALCARLGIHPNKFYELANMKTSPLDNDGGWKKIVVEICDLLDCMPEDLFSDEQINSPIEKNKFTLTADLEELGYLSERSLNTSQEFKVLRDDTRDVLDKVLAEHLSPRQRDVLIRHYGLFGNEKQTHADIGKIHNVCNQRVRQIIDQATQNLQKIKHIKELKNNSSLGALRSLLAAHDDAHQGRLY